MNREPPDIPTPPPPPPKVLSSLLDKQGTLPEGPCTHIVYIWALTLLYGNPFRAQVYTR